ncbi:MAG: hypothetical protein ACPGO3_02205 [Magnetospiraceae bacterium]
MLKLKKIGRLLGTAAMTALLSCGLALPGQAAEESVDFRLVTRSLDLKVEQIPTVEGQMVGLGHFAGVALFSDGRIANKDFRFSFDYMKGAGPFFGYSTYTFEDGSALTMRFAGENKAGTPMRGEYTILSGTGKYEGATGSGYFEAQDDPWEGANLFAGALQITTP